MPTITIHDILAQFREEELHNRHRGDRFERLICRYLELDPIFADRFSNIWMWNEWPSKGSSGDTGIDFMEAPLCNTCRVHSDVRRPTSTQAQTVYHWQTLKNLFLYAPDGRRV